MADGQGVTITFSFPASLAPAEAEIVATAMAKLFVLKGGQGTWSFSLDSDPIETYKLGGLSTMQILEFFKAAGVVA